MFDSRTPPSSSTAVRSCTTRSSAVEPGRDRHHRRRHRVECSTWTAGRRIRRTRTSRRRTTSPSAPCAGVRSRDAHPDVRRRSPARRRPRHPSCTRPSKRAGRLRAHPCDVPSSADRVSASASAALHRAAKSTATATAMNPRGPLSPLSWNRRRCRRRRPRRRSASLTPHPLPCPRRRLSRRRPVQGSTQSPDQG